MNSYSQTKSRFDSRDVASHYPASFGRTFRERREVTCLLRALQYVPAGSSVLDLPCGTGRLLSALVTSKFRVTAADVSAHMLRQAEKNWQRERANSPDPTSEIEFRQSDAIQTGFPDAHFDAVVCHRLVHHLAEPHFRVAVLRELRRISKGPLIVSFFNSFALNALKSKLKRLRRRTKPTYRFPIRLSVFARDIEESGLRIISSHPVLWGISPLWYLVLSQTGSKLVQGDTVGGELARPGEAAADRKPACTPV